MYKIIGLFALLFAGFVHAEPLIVQPNSLVNPKVQAEVGAKCKESCIVLDQADWAMLMEQVKAAQERAFQAGKLAERKTL